MRGSRKALKDFANHVVHIHRSCPITWETNANATVSLAPAARGPVGKLLPSLKQLVTNWRGNMTTPWPSIPTIWGELAWLWRSSLCLWHQNPPHICCASLLWLLFSELIRSWAYPTWPFDGVYVCKWRNTLKHNPTSQIADYPRIETDMLK